MIKRGVGSGAAKLPKICDFDLKNDFFAKKDRKKSQKPFQKILSILNIEGLILATKDCKKASRLGIRDSRRSRFSAHITK